MFVITYTFLYEQSYCLASIIRKYFILPRAVLLTRDLDRGSVLLRIKKNQ